MALLKRLNSRAKSVNDTGFGTNSNMYGGRYFNKDGNPNLHKIGIPLLERISWYHTLLEMSRIKFLLVIFLTYLGMNLMFAIIYLVVGVEKLDGMIVNSPIEKFGEAFFFSAQTFTTVGYGRLSPTGFATSFIASFEALVGLLSFAVATGLMYGRFSRPKAFVKFSNNAVIAPFQDTIGFMFRLVPYKNNDLSEAEVKMMLAMILEENGVVTNKFYPLDLEINKVASLALNWTVVHPINESSPFYGLSKEDLINAKAEILVFFKAFDDTFSSTVMDKTSYITQEIIFGAKFNTMYHRDEEGGSTVLDVSLLNSYYPADISFTNMIKLNENTAESATA